MQTTTIQQTANLNIHPEAIIRLPTVISMTGLGRSSIYEAVAAGGFPKQVSLGKRAVGWRMSDILEWIATRSVA